MDSSKTSNLIASVHNTTKSGSLVLVSKRDQKPLARYSFDKAAFLVRKRSFGYTGYVHDHEFVVSGVSVPDDFFRFIVTDLVKYDVKNIVVMETPLLLLSKEMCLSPVNTITGKCDLVAVYVSVDKTVGDAIVHFIVVPDSEADITYTAMSAYSIMNEKYTEMSHVIPATVAVKKKPATASDSKPAPKPGSVTEAPDMSRISITAKTPVSEKASKELAENTQLFFVKERPNVYREIIPGSAESKNAIAMDFKTVNRMSKEGVKFMVLRKKQPVPPTAPVSKPQAIVKTSHRHPVTVSESVPKPGPGPKHTFDVEHDSGSEHEYDSDSEHEHGPDSEHEHDSDSEHGPESKHEHSSGHDSDSEHSSELKPVLEPGSSKPVHVTEPEKVSKKQQDTDDVSDAIKRLRSFFTD